MTHPTSEQILDHLLGTGPALDAHLDGCADCRAQGDAWRRTETALAEFYRVPRRPPGGLAGRLVGRLPTRQPARFLGLGRLVPLAATLMICLAVLWKVSRPLGPPADLRKQGAEWIAFIDDTPRKGETQMVWLLNPATDERRRVTSGFDSYSSPTFSPDGRRLAFLRSRGVAMSLVTRRPRTRWNCRRTSTPISSSARTARGSSAATKS